MDAEPKKSIQRVTASCRAGNVNGRSGPAVDVLFVNGGIGDPLRILRTFVGRPLTIDLSNAPSRARSRFVIFGFVGVVGSGSETQQPFDLGTMCFATPLNGAGAAITLANTIGHESQLGLPLIRRRLPAAPTRVLEATMARPVEVCLQGLILNDASLSSHGVAITNAVIVTVE